MSALPAHLAPDIQHHAALDARMVRAARGIKLLTMASWPAGLEAPFLADYARGVARLPVIDYPKHDFSDVRAELDAVARDSDPDHPLGEYLIESAHSWGIAAQLLECLGTRQVTDLSVQLFGKPDAALPGHGPTTREAANHFISIANELDRELMSPAETVQISATALSLQLQRDLDDYFDSRVIDVVLDPELIAKAAAGATRIRLRSGAAFSDYDRHQLLQHEAFVHSLTALNGREQTQMLSLALGSPRTTLTQEGLAVFAELISGSIDLARLKRISLRTVAIQQAMAGADFIEVFRYFMAAGQSDVESFASAQRVFRGVPLTGGTAFNKDTVYLGGLLSVHAFFRAALAERRLDRCRNLFVGKLALADVMDLEPCFADGTITAPRWLPPWMQRAGATAGWLAFSLFAHRIGIDRLDALAPGTDSSPVMSVDRQTGAV